MQIKSLLWLLVLTASPLLAQDEDTSVEAPPAREIQEPAAVSSKPPDTKAPDAKTSESKASSKAGANFQPSEEIMADTMLTLPADI